MPRLCAERLSFTYSDTVPLLSDVTFTLDHGFAGVVGENGAGKSTLLRLLSGKLAPSSGRVRTEPVPCRFVHCVQDVDELSDEVLSFGESEDGPARRSRARLALDPNDLSRWPTLSPGERRRWQLAAALAQQPDVLLVDEPTNHLDEKARELVLAALAAFRGVGLCVTHDREVLARLCSKTLRVHGGSARLYAEPYEAARRSWQSERDAIVTARAQARERVVTLEQRLDRSRRAELAASKQRSVSRRQKSRHDSDARTITARNLADWAAASHGRKATVLGRELERAQSELARHVVEKELGAHVFAAYEACPKPLLLAVEAGVVQAGERPLFESPALVLKRSDRVALRGENGSGKTTFLTRLVEHLRQNLDRLAYVPQHLSAEFASDLLERVRALSKQERGRVLTVVAALGLDPERLLASQAPSPGETRKLALALGLGGHSYLLVLDEPTNHLDLPSIERMERALAEYPGALLVVTHDREFARRTTEAEWLLGGGRLTVTR